MDIVNIEIKARCHNPENIRQQLIDAQAEYKGLDHQIDTYFNTEQGRLKLRQGSIEKSLIFYDRPESKSLKTSTIILNRLTENDEILRKQLMAAIGSKVVVDKQRHIYFIDNVKFHVDHVEGLGHFVEIEAIGKPGEEPALQKQCQHYVNFLAIDQADFIDKSYSDMILDLA